MEFVSCRSLFCTSIYFPIIFQVNKYAFSGGQDSVELHRKLGANLEVHPFPVVLTHTNNKLTQVSKLFWRLDSMSYASFYHAFFYLEGKT